jgi:glycerol kinase
MLAGLAEGVWGSIDDLRSLSRAEATFEPVASVAKADRDHAGWLRALERSRSLAVTSSVLAVDWGHRRP